MRILTIFLLLFSAALLIDGRGGRGGSGRGRSQGRSRSGSSWGYGQAKSSSRNGGGSYSGGGGYYASGAGRGNVAGMLGGSGAGNGQPYIRKQPTQYYRAGIGSFHTSTVAKTAIGLAALPLATRAFGNNVIRDKEAPLKVDGVNYYWSAEYVPERTTKTICALHVDSNDTSFSNITFTDLKRVSEIAWSCANSTYCCGLTCCGTGYEGSPLGTVGSIGLGFLSLAALLIPGAALVSLQRGVSTNELK